MWRQYCEQQPLKFIDREVFQHLVHGIRKLARFIGELLCEYAII